nr:hypothetical protein [Algoriphagus sp.]
KVKMSRYGILDTINKSCIEPKVTYPTLNLFKSRAYTSNKDWMMETAKGDIYIRCANDKFQIEQKKVDIRFGDIEYIQSEAKKYNALAEQTTAEATKLFTSIFPAEKRITNLDRQVSTKVAEANQVNVSSLLQLLAETAPTEKWRVAVGALIMYFNKV